MKAAGRSPLDIAETGRFCYNFAWDPQITDAQADDLAKSCVDKGVNILMLNHHHFRWSHVDLFEEIEQATRIIVEACHKLDVLVVEHHSSTAASGKHTYKGRRISDWANRNVATGEAGYVPIHHGDEYHDAWWCCLNNPEWQESYYDYITNFFSVTGVDGLMHDDIHFCPGSMYCGCEHCREKFSRIFCYDLPRGEDHPAWENFDSQTWRDWIMFRRMSTGDEFERISKVLGPDKLLFGCCSVGLNTTIGIHDAGYTYEDFARGANVLSQETIYHARNESCPRYYLFEYKRHFLDRKLYSALSAVKGGRPCVSYPYPASPNEDFFCWSLVKAFAHCYKSAGDLSRPDPTFRRWEADNEQLFGDPREVANIGLVHSSTTMSLTGVDSKYYLDELRGWGEAMIEDHIPFRIVLSDTDFDESRLEGLSLLILPNIRCLSEPQMSIIRDYVREGGNVILTYETSLCDEHGAGRDNFGFSDLLGFDYKKSLEGIDLPIYPVPQKDSPIMAGAGDRLAYHGPHAICSLPNDMSDIAAWIEKYNPCAFGPPAPAVIEGTYGKGRFIYFSFKPGLTYAVQGTCAMITKDYTQQFVAQARTIKPPIWIDERIPEHKKLITNAISSLIQREALPYEVLDAPEGLLINAYTQQDRLVLALINVKGAAIGHGERLPAVGAAEYPALQGVVRVRLNGCCPKEAYLVSPDLPAGEYLELKQVDGGSVLTVSGSSVRRFGLAVVSVDNSA